MSHGRTNPGNFELLHRETRDVFAQFHFVEGARFELNRPLSQNFQLTHRFLLGPQNDYQFGTFFAHNRGFLTGEIDSAGNLAGRVQQSLLDNLSLKFIINIPTKRQSHATYDFELTGEDYTANFKALNPDVVQGTGGFVVGYLQSVTQNLALGVEGMIQKGPANTVDSGMTFVAKYTGKDFVATTNLGLNGSAQASYFHKINEQVSLGSDIEILANSAQRESIFTFGGKFDLRQTKFRAQIDTHGKVAAVMEEMLTPGLSFVISGEIDHAQTKSRFGLGLIVGGH